MNDFFSELVFLDFESKQRQFSGVVFSIEFTVNLWF
jgi:hypothetical protein